MRKITETSVEIDKCEICKKPITEDQSFYCDSEGVTWHKECGDENGD